MCWSSSFSSAKIWTTIIPSVAVPLSLLGTLGVMYLVGYSLDNLSLMALTISTGFVVDDAIVVIENITRYLGDGFQSLLDAAMKGSREIGFTVLSMSTSPIAVFIILLMGGIIGKLFREFAVTLSVAIAVSLLVSLTTRPCSAPGSLKQRDEETATDVSIASRRTRSSGSTTSTTRPCAGSCAING